MESKILTIAVIALLGLTIGCGGGGNGGGNGGGPRLIVGDISGPATILETSSADYSITAAGDTGITYLWAVVPFGAGVLSPQNTDTTNFTASEVDTDTPATLRVVVKSDNDGPILKEIEITIEDSTSQSNPELVVGEIIGPPSGDEYSSWTYSVAASGDTGITYLWAVDPPDSGVLSPQNTDTTNFTASEVDTDTSAVLTVVVNSDNDGPIIKSIDITIEDSTPQSNPELEVGDIIGPQSGDEYSSWTYSVAASGDSGITYEWSNDPLDIGNFGNPNVDEPLYSTYGVGVDTDVEIIVAVNSDNFGPVIRSMTTTVLDSINPAQYLGGGHPIEGVNYYRNNRSPYPMPSDLAGDDLIEGLYGVYDSFRELLISENERLYVSHEYYKNIKPYYNHYIYSHYYTRSFNFGEDYGEAVQSGYGMVLTDSGLYSIIRSKFSSSEDYQEPSGLGYRESGLDKYGAWPILEQHISAEWHYNFHGYFPYYNWFGELDGMHIFDVFPLPDGSTLVAFARSGTYFQDPPTYIASLDGSFNTEYESDLLTAIRGISFDEPTGHIYISTVTGLYCYDLSMNQLWDTTSNLPAFSSTFAVIADDGGAIGVANGQLKRVEPDGSIGTVVDCGPYLRPAITNNGSVAVITADTLQIYDQSLNFIYEFPLPTGPGTGEIYTKTPLIGSDGNIALTTETDLYIFDGSGTEIAHRTFDAKIHGLRLGPEHLFVATVNKIYRFAN